MKEGKKGVQRLLRALSEQIDEENAQILAWLLHYHQPQLMDDIASIQDIEIINKGEKSE